ncbi:LysR family transcriptional regulator [Aliagarivorans marinus]|uniref:LysR family transcriptional regulator n=1 Tax=Aliagarivorans marinus TaxID=561965 RepID=UPI000427AF73|nr:LysR family transcriptional regulator [Aliagarivorans marinus]
MDFAKFDLNLLRTLLVLLQEKNTHKAAEKLQTSQPAVSRSLAKLREELDDPLFLRHSRGLKLTERAEELARTLPKAIHELQRSLEGEVFNPRGFKGHCRIALNAYLAETHGYAIYAFLHEHCPELQVELHAYSSNTRERLLSGELDFALSYSPKKISKDLCYATVATQPHGAICRADFNPQINSLNVEQMAMLNLAALIIPEFNDEQLFVQAISGIHYHPLFRAQHLNLVLRAVQQQNLVLTAPASLLDKLDPKHYRFVPIYHKQAQLTAELSLMFDTSHYRSPKYLWLEQSLRQLLAEQA